MIASTPTEPGDLDHWRQLFADERSGLRYRDRIGPALPALNGEGLGYVRDDLLARAAHAERQAAQAWSDGEVTLASRCDGIASGCRDAAAQIVTYSLDPAWSVPE